MACYCLGRAVFYSVCPLIHRKKKSKIYCIISNHFTARSTELAEGKVEESVLKVILIYMVNATFGSNLLDSGNGQVVFYKQVNLVVGCLLMHCLLKTEDTSWFSISMIYVLGLHEMQNKKFQSMF